MGSRSAVVACVPTVVAELIAGGDPLPDAVELMVWDGHGSAPGRGPDIDVWVPPFLWSPDGLDDVLAALPRLRVIQLTSAGYEQYADRVPPGAVLCNGRGIHGGSTSEWVLAAMLASLRRIPEFVRAQDERAWEHDLGTDELAGKRVLIVGAGDLGENTATRVRAFDAEPVLVASTARGGVHGVEELPDLLPDADVVVLVLPLTDRTAGLVDAQFLARMRDGALLVNGARGPIVDTGALLVELSAGRLRAALDVTDPEPLPPEHPLWTAPNLVLTPHVGGSVPGYPARAAALVANQLSRFAAGECLTNVVVEGPLRR
ncbi:MAG: 2-hydroxyacid dehydrogenase [bacterium]